MNTTIYTADSQLANPRRFVASMAADLASSGPLAWRLALRNIRGQYRRSLLGYLWAVLPVLMTTLVWVVLNATGMLAIRATELPYPAFVLVNMTLWQVFVDAIFSPLQQVGGAGSMLTKVKFARESLILAGLIESLFTFVIRLVLMLIGLLLFRVPLHATILLAPLAILALVLLGTTLGLLLLPLSLLYDDVRRGLIIITGLWLFVTPVIYPPPTTRPLVFISFANPVTPLLVTARELLTTGVVTHPLAFTVVSVLTLFLLAWACLLYRVAMPHLIARMSN